MSAMIDLNRPGSPADPSLASPAPSDSLAPAGHAPVAPALPAASPIPRLSRGPAVPLSPTFTPPLIPDVEALPEWDFHLNAVRGFYAPEGYLEDACAFRIAALLWRLNRLGRSEIEHLAQSLADAERDAASVVAGQATEPPHIRPLLPVDVADLRRFVKDAKLAAKVLPEFHHWPSHEPVSDDHARLAHYFLSAFYSHSPDEPPIDKPPAGWDGSRLRSALSKLAVNRTLYDDIQPATAFAKDLVAAAEQRLAHIESLTARLRRERLVPHSPLAHDIRESETALSTQLDEAIRHLDLLQARRVGLNVNV